MIIQLLKQYRKKIIYTTLISALSSLVSIALLAKINTKMNASDSISLMELVPSFLLLVVILFVMSFVSQFLLVKFGSSFVGDLRKDLLQQTVDVDYEQLEKIGGHRILATITNDVSSIASALTITPLFTVNLATILFCLLYLCIQSPSLFVFLVSGLFLGFSLSFFIMKKGRASFAELREREDRLFNIFKSLIDGSKELNINQNRKSFFLHEQALPILEEVRDKEIKAKTYWVLSDSIARPLLFLVLGLVLFAGQYIVSVETSVLTSFVLFTTFIIGPLGSVQNSFQALTKGWVAYKKIQNLQLTKITKKKLGVNTNDVLRWQALEFKNISYTYQTGGNYQFTLGPINLSIRRGDKIFICGGNGSGKSTFAKLLVGLYQPHCGAITLDGHSIDESNVQTYRSHFSTIFSDFFLFEHILDSHGERVIDKELTHHLRNLKLIDKVEVINGKISTTSLSQGQRKRLAMLIAYAEDAPIYLFDEWAADQDPEFREYFYLNILPELKAKGKTLIVITHDDKYYSLADRLIKFENGRASDIPLDSYNNVLTA